MNSGIPRWCGRRSLRSGTGISGDSHSRRYPVHSGPRSATRGSLQRSGRPQWWGCTKLCFCTGTGYCSEAPSDHRRKLRRRKRGGHQSVRAGLGTSSLWCSVRKVSLHHDITIGFCLFVMFLLDKISSIPGWSQTRHVVKDVLELLTLRPECWDFRCEPPQPDWCHAGDWIKLPKC